MEWAPGCRSPTIKPTNLRMDQSTLPRWLSFPLILRRPSQNDANVACSYRIGWNFHGISAGRAMKLYVSQFSIGPGIRNIIPGHCNSWNNQTYKAQNSGITAGSFAVVGGIFALQFFSEVPKVRNDILQVRLDLLLRLE